MKIAIFALLMVVVLTLVESEHGSSHLDPRQGLRSKRDLSIKLVQQNLGNRRKRQTRDINQKHQSVEDTIKQVLRMSKRNSQHKGAGK